jgi:NDP-sugar pyrophosphorylase family protein
VTYGDVVPDVSITGLVSFHRRQGSLGTLTAVQPRAVPALTLHHGREGVTVHGVAAHG